MRGVSGWVILVAVVALMAVTAVGAVLAYSGVRQLAIEASEIAGLEPFDPFDVIGPSRTPVGLVGPPTPTATPTRLAADPPTATPDESQATTVAAAESGDLEGVEGYADPSRITILLLGIDQRQGEQGPFRTDTMMVLSLDPVRRSAVMLSIPRDLWVSIPGFQNNRINTANALGDSAEYPGGGPALAAATVEQNLGIHIDHTVRINFDLFLTAVNAIAPVEVCIDQEIHDDHYPDGSYGIMTVHFDPGCHDLNAEQLLQFARTRATEGGDFDRAARQQQTIRAIRDRVLSLGGVQALLSQASTLWESARENIQTTLSFEEIVSLALLAQDIPPENIRQGVLDANYVQFRTTTSGDQVLVMRPGAARQLVAELFNPAQMSEEELRRLAAGENVRLSVVNGTEIAGLAADTQAWLEGQGFTVTHVGNADRTNYRETLIRDHNNNPYSARLLATLLGIPTTRVVPDNTRADYDLQIVVGEDLLPVVRGE